MEDVASRIVDKAMALGCQDAVADVVENRSYQIRFARNEAVISNQWRESNASVFVVHGKRVVASDVRDLSKTDEAVERLVKIAKTSQANPDFAGIAKGPFGYARTRPDPKVLSLHEGGKYVEAAVGGALDQGAKECAGSFWKYEDEHFLATSNGAEGHDHRASLYLSIRALVSLESSGHGIACASKLSQFQPEKAGDRKSTRLNSSHGYISYAVFCLKKKIQNLLVSPHLLTSAITASARIHSSPPPSPRHDITHA